VPNELGGFNESYLPPFPAKMANRIIDEEEEVEPKYYNFDQVDS